MYFGIVLENQSLTTNGRPIVGEASLFTSEVALTRLPVMLVCRTEQTGLKRSEKGQVMAITKPYRRTCRQFLDGSYAEGGRSRYIKHDRYAMSASHYIRAFLVLQSDFQRLCDYIEPSDINLSAYSFRTHELLCRVCIEVEANAKAILSENGYTPGGLWSMRDYSLIEQSHLLSAYEVSFSHWTGVSEIRQPFAPWATDNKLEWYQAYNRAKHDRHTNFADANFKNLTDAICGLVAILSAQFNYHDFALVDHMTLSGSKTAGFESSIGGQFEVKYPSFPIADRYNFDWQALKEHSDPFEDFPYEVL
jgi:hypothetical protein